MLESLENRTLFAATAVLAGSTLVITGTPVNDNIQVNIAGPLMNVTLNGVPKWFAAGAVKNIQAKLLDGNDAFIANNSVFQPILVLAGNGNDSVVGGRGNDRFYGENGTDKLVGNLGHDFLHGGNDSDYLYGLSGSDTLVGGFGRDYCDGGLDRDNIHTAGDGALDQIKKDPLDFVNKDAWDVLV